MSSRRSGYWEIGFTDNWSRLCLFLSTTSLLMWRWWWRWRLLKWWFLWPKLLHGWLVLDDCRHIEVATIPNYLLPHLTIIAIIITIITIIIDTSIIIITIVTIIISIITIYIIDTSIITIIRITIIIVQTFSNWSPAWSFPEVVATPRGCNPQMYVRIMSRSWKCTSALCYGPANVRSHYVTMLKMYVRIMSRSWKCTFIVCHDPDPQRDGHGDHEHGCGDHDHIDNGDDAAWLSTFAPAKLSPRP